MLSPNLIQELLMMSPSRRHQYLLQAANRIATALDGYSRAGETIPTIMFNDIVSGALNFQWAITQDDAPPQRM